MSSKVWLASRAAMALGLMVSFYVLAIGVAAVLVWLTYAQVAYLRHANLKITLVLLGAAALILWSILPRPDRFVAPGPRVEPADEPMLFSTLEEIAASTGQAMPADVYLVNDVNAFVAQRGGIMGLGSRRVMGLGLPLMQAVTVQELKGIVAHEFGHYHSGDVALGPWIHKTREAIGRTIEQLSGSVLQKIFIWYGNLFLRITHAVSRRQEFIADEVAARAAGAGIMIAGLRKVHAAAVAFQHYWFGEVAQVLGSGYLPPISQGFSRFMQQPAIVANMSAVVEHEETRGETSPYDTHPALRDRVAALSLLPAGASDDTGPAVSLLSNVPGWERRILAAVVNDDWARGLEPVEWERIVESVYVPMWRERVRQHRKLLAPLTIATIPTTRLGLVRLGIAYAGAAGEETMHVPDEVRVRTGLQLLTSAMAVALMPLGWTARAALGEEVVLARGGEELRPVSEIIPIAEDKKAAADWRARCAALGIADVRLAGEAERGTPRSA